MFKTITEIKQANKAHGHHWFDKDSMRFFRTRIESKVFSAPSHGCCYFVTSEQFDDNAPRLYTVRRAYESGSIGTVGEFQMFETRAEAVNFARAHVALSQIAA